MMARSVWTRLKTGVERAREDNLRRVAIRLAAQTIGLLLVMLVTLEVIFYVLTQQSLIGSLETTLKDRANPPPGFVHDVFGISPYAAGYPGFHQGLPGGLGRQGPNPRGPGPGPNPDLSPSEASVAFVTPNLHIRHADGALGNILLAPADVRRAVRTGQPQCCSVHAYEDQDYLVFTRPLRANGTIVGAAQSSISEHQYEETMNSLLRTMLVVALLGLAISGGVSGLLVNRAIRPVRLAMQRQRDFVADAAHELRTPLAIMRTVGEVGMAAPSADELQAAISQMLDENQHLTRLVEDLSLLARTDTNTVTIDRCPVDLSALVGDTTTELSYLAEEQGITLQTDIQGSIHLLGDTVRLRQLLLILLDNALKHTPAGGTVQVRLAEHDRRIRLEVADSGPGIPPADLPHIFDRFYRADQSRTGEGSGLGLAIGKWIVDAHGGQIHAVNAPNRGAVFTVTLPATRAAAPVHEPDQSLADQPL
jgi:signal transduction histidine kinase